MLTKLTRTRTDKRPSLDSRTQNHTIGIRPFNAPPPAGQWPVVGRLPATGGIEGPNSDSMILALVSDAALRIFRRRLAGRAVCMIRESTPCPSGRILCSVLITDLGLKERARARPADDDDDNDDGDRQASNEGTTRAKPRACLRPSSSYANPSSSPPSPSGARARSAPP